MKILGLIPARSGSKGIPNKNIKLLNGIPLLGYVANDAKRAGLLAKVIISTDSREIAEVATKYGLEFPFLRPDEFSGDKSPSVDFVRHAILTLKERGEEFDAVCLLQPTSPFKPSGFIDQCLQAFVDGELDSLISVLQVPHEFNPHWTFEESAPGVLKIATGEQQLIPRRQDLPKAFYRDGAVYIFKSELVLRENRLVGGKTGYVLSDPAYYCNLDTMEDWYLAEEKVNNF